MNFSRTLQIPAIVLLGVSFTPGFMLAQTSGTTPAPAAQQDPLKDDNVVEDIVARINDQIITQSDFHRAQQQMESDLKQQNADPGVRQKDLLRDLIDQQLLISRGKELEINGETELVRRLDEIRKQNHLDSMEDLEKAAQAQGVSYEDFKANIRNSIITQQVVRQEVSRHVAINEAEVQRYFKAHESEFAQPESVHLSEILIPTPVGAGGEAPDAAQISAAQAKADGIAAKLKAGGSFADLAKANSGGSTAAGGGDLGEFRRNQLAPLLEEKTFGLQAGQFTDPIRTKQGFIILQVTQHNAGGDASFQQVEPQVQEALFMERMQPALRQYLTKLREQAYIEIKPGYDDSGASPNELRITNSAYVPPGPKKKKKFQRTRFRGRARTAKPVTVATVSATTPAATSKKKQTASQGVQKLGKKEKIRYGQAPRESLPAAPAAAAPAEDAQVATATDAANATTSSSVTPQTDIGSINSAPEAAPQGKTRYSARPKVHKTKKEKAEEVEANKPPPATPEEIATQKVQNAPLDLSEQPSKKKKKVKGEKKTRFSAKPKAPEQTPQPYMGNQPPADNPQPAANGSQPKADDSQTAPKN